MKKKIAIIGAGVAGLTFANLIKKNSEHSCDESSRVKNRKSTNNFFIQIQFPNHHILNLEAV